MSMGRQSSAPCAHKIRQNTGRQVAASTDNREQRAESSARVLNERERQRERAAECGVAAGERQEQG